NITLAPWGDLLVCEDTSESCSLVGITQDGQLYQLANNAYSSSELAGACFSPDGSTLFLNIQHPGMTLAIQGPFINR
ncbi:MAG TPA: alkaline phosphatase PhoX, partial [Gammaproteobacteria bacterium]|nr:alkaline phosphatase PhoX [Gammaproteobacteria bacterium]